MISRKAQPPLRKAPEGAQAVEHAVSIRDYLFDHGPKTAQELAGELCIGEKKIHIVLKDAKHLGLIEVVAHVHGKGNKKANAWYVLGRDQAWIGHLCTCTQRERYKPMHPVVGPTMTYEPNYLPWLYGGE